MRTVQQREPSRRCSVGPAPPHSFSPYSLSEDVLLRERSFYDASTRSHFRPLLCSTHKQGPGRWHFEWSRRRQVDRGPPVRPSRGVMHHRTSPREVALASSAIHESYGGDSSAIHRHDGFAMNRYCSGCLPSTTRCIPWFSRISDASFCTSETGSAHPPSLPPSPSLFQSLYPTRAHLLGSRLHPSPFLLSRTLSSVI